MKSFEALQEFLTKGRDSLIRRISANTTVERRTVDSIAVRYHQTDVVTHYRDGSVMLKNAGWYTSTTRIRIEEYSRIRIDGPMAASTRQTQREGGPWDVYTGTDSARFECGMVIPAGESLQAYKAAFYAASKQHGFFRGAL